MLNGRILVISDLLCAVTLQTGCNEMQALRQPAKSVSDSKQAPQPEQAKPVAEPKISFEKTVYDFGELGKSEKRPNRLWKNFIKKLTRRSRVTKM